MFGYRGLISSRGRCPLTPWGETPHTPRRMQRADAEGGGRWRRQRADAEGGCRGRMQRADALGGSTPTPPADALGFETSTASALCVRPTP
jgi:hypothetical protein